jgi:DNA-binding transcriptional MerR regulator
MLDLSLGQAGIVLYTHGMTGITIGAAAALTGLSVHTLRMYERDGLLTSSPTRDAGGRRVYTQGDLDWLETCCRFRMSGMPLAEIAKFATYVREGEGNELARLDLLRAHEKRIADQRTDLAKASELITAKIAAYELHLAKGTAAALWT